MSVLAIIPIRFHSNRFPGKAMHIYKEKPLSEWVYEAVSKVKSIDRIVIATDNHRVKLHFDNLGAEVYYSEFEHRCGTERCAEVSRQLEEYALILNVQGDEVGIKEENLEFLIQKMKERDQSDIGTLKFKISDPNLKIHDSNLVKVVCQPNQKALYFSRLPIPYNQTGDPTSYYKHIGIYAYYRNCLRSISKLKMSTLEQSEKLEQLRWLENGFNIFAFDAPLDSQSVNVPADLKDLII